jgi:hypothetical protein
MALAQPDDAANRPQSNVRISVWASVAVGLAALGCTSNKPQPKSNAALIKQAATELPAAEEKATQVGLHYQLDYYRRNVPKAENAAYSYVRADELFRKPELPDISGDQVDPKAIAAREKFVALLKPAMDIAERASTLPHCDFKSGKPLDAFLDHEPTLKLFADAFDVRAIVDAHEGRYSDAGRDIEIAGRFTTHMLDGGTDTLGNMAAYKVEDRTAAICELVLCEQHGNEECARQLELGFAHFPKRIEFLPSIGLEAAVMLHLSTYQAAVGLGDVPDTKDVRIIALYKAGEWVDTGTAIRAISARTLQYYTALYQAGSAPTGTDKERADRLIEVSEKEQASDFTHALDPDLSYEWRALLSYQSRFLATNLGLEHIANPKGKWPTVVDPYTDKPFQISQTREGFTISSVGIPGPEGTRFEYPIPTT